MLPVLRPRDANDAEAALASAAAEGKTLEIVSGGSKRGIGRAAQWDCTLDLSALSGITLYEPNELVLSAKAATPMAEIKAALSSHGQELAFEPNDYSVLLGSDPARATVAGVLAANAAGPRRIRAGAARDHFLGFHAVSGWGESFKSGGRVVKNVTGYDLSKLLAGSWGTLAAMTEVTVKVLPRAESEQSLVVLALSDEQAGAVMRLALKSAGEVSGAAHIPADLAAEFVLAGAPQSTSMTVLRLEGVPSSIAHRRQLLQSLLREFGAQAVLDEPDSRSLWRWVRDVHAFVPRAGSSRAVWRISTSPTSGPRLGTTLRQELPARVLYDWAGGLLWVECSNEDDASASGIRARLLPLGGHATLIRAPASVRAAIDVFQPQDRVHAELTKRVKASFDPRGILNPGRMYSGC